MRKTSTLIPLLLLLFLVFYPGFSDERTDLFKKLKDFFTEDSSTITSNKSDKKSLLSDELNKSFDSTLSEKTVTNQVVSNQESNFSNVEEKVLSSKSTGAPADSGLTSVDKQVWVKIWELRDVSPISNSYFNLSFNEKTRVFDVHLSNNYGQDEFNAWLENNGYGIIPDSQFVFLMK